jgi:heptosyltransferase II
MKKMALEKVQGALGTVLAAVLPPPRRGTMPDPRRILVIRPGGIGDALLLIPAILALREKFPAAEIKLLAGKRNSSAFQLCPAVDHLLLHDEPRDLWRALRGGYDLVIDSEQWGRLSAVVTRLSAPVSIGFATNNRKRLFTHQVPYSHDHYEALSFFRLLEPLGIQPPEKLRSPFLVIPPDSASAADTLLAKVHGRPFAVVYPGAGTRERRWGHQRFREVAQRLVLMGLQVVVVGGEEDEDEGDFIVRPCGGVNLAGKTTLAETAAVIARSIILVTGESGILQLGVGLGIPTVSLFGPGIEAKWGGQGEGDVVVNRRLACSPCSRFGSTPRCPSQVRCLSEITPQEVVAAIDKLLSKLYPSG